jgi:hypothetical protein
MRPFDQRNKCQAPGAGSGWGARPAATRAFMDDDAIEHHMTLFLSCIHPYDPFRQPGATAMRRGHPDVCGPPLIRPLRLTQGVVRPDPVSTIDKPSVAR